MSVPRRLLAAALSLAALLALALSGSFLPRPAPRYTVTDLGVLPGDSISGAGGLNTHGEVVGYTQGAVTRPCVFRNGTVTSLSLPPSASGGKARGLNARGEVTGTLDLPTAHHAFVYSAGKVRDLGALPGFHDSEGIAVNDLGEVTGNLRKPLLQPGPFQQQHAFLYSQGRITDLGTLPGSLESQARSINSAGQITGECYTRSGLVYPIPFLYNRRQKTMTALPMPPPYSGGWGYAFHVNEHGQVIGAVSTANSPSIAHAVLWSGGSMIDLGTPPGLNSSVGMGLNNHREAVGYCFNGGPIWFFLQDHLGDNPLGRYMRRDTHRAFVCHGGKMQDLNELIPADSGWLLENARDINDRGQIVGSGLHQGQERAYLLTPR